MAKMRESAQFERRRLRARERCVQFGGNLPQDADVVLCAPLTRRHERYGLRLHASNKWRCSVQFSSVYTAVCVLVNMTTCRTQSKALIANIAYTVQQAIGIRVNDLKNEREKSRKRENVREMGTCTVM